jgi:hypothetical protein
VQTVVLPQAAPSITLRMTYARKNGYFAEISNIAVFEAAALLNCLYDISSEFMSLAIHVRFFR